MQLKKIDAHGLSIRGRNSVGGRDHFAVADLNKSMRVHQTNLSFEDRSRLHGRTQGHVFLIADEAGSARTPGSAGSAAVDGVVQYLLNEMPWYHLASGEPADIVLALEDALENARHELSARTGARDMGTLTSLTLAFVSWPDLYVAQVGRGRCYLQRDDRLIELTRREPRARDRLRRRPRTEQPLVLHRSLEVGDVLALVSESLIESWPGERLADVLRSRRSSEAMCAELLSGIRPEDRTAVLARFVPQASLPAGLGGDAPDPDLDARRDRARQRLRPSGRLRWSHPPGRRLPSADRSAGHRTRPAR